MVVKENGNQLILIPDSFIDTLRILFKAAPYAFGAALLLIATAQESKAEALIGLVVIIIVGWILLIISSEESAYYTVFDKDTLKITFTLRSPLNFLFPSTRKLQFEKLSALVLNNVEEKGLTLSLLLKSGMEIPFAGPATADSAEQISRFLRIPLKIQMEGETITHMPWVSDKESALFPTPCANPAECPMSNRIKISILDEEKD